MNSHTVAVQALAGYRRTHNIAMDSSCKVLKCMCATLYRVSKPVQSMPKKVYSKGGTGIHGGIKEWVLLDLRPASPRLPNRTRVAGMAFPQDAKNSRAMPGISKMRGRVIVPDWKAQAERVRKTLPGKLLSRVLSSIRSEHQAHAPSKALVCKWSELLAVSIRGCSAFA